MLAYLTHYVIETVCSKWAFDETSFLPHTSTFLLYRIKAETGIEKHIWASLYKLRVSQLQSVNVKFLHNIESERTFSIALYRL